MSDNLVPIRLRVALPPREPRPYRPGKAPRRAVLLHEHAGRHIAIELLDGQATSTVVSLGVSPSDEEVAAAEVWAAHHQDVGAGKVGIVSRPQLGKIVEQRCYWSGSALVTFDLDRVSGTLAVFERDPGAGQRTDVWHGCGWFQGVTGEPMDALDRARLRLTRRTADGGGSFASWLPRARQRRSKKRRGGPFVQPDVFGGALGYDTSSPAALAASLDIDWPDLADPLDQLLGEALALVAIYKALVAELAEVAPELAPQDAWSAGSLATHLLRRAGMRAPFDTTATLPPEVLGACASAFHGGLPEAHLVGVGLPMVLADINATYPSMFSLLGLTPHLAADHFEVVAATPAEVRDLFRSDGFRDRLDDRGWWQSVGDLFVEIEPHDDWTPFMRKAGAGWRFVVAPLDLSGGTMWVHACDLVVPTLAGQLPRIVRAFRIVPVPAVEGFKSVRLPSGQTLDLGAPGADWGRAHIEERALAKEIEDPRLRARREALAKGLGVTGCWGIFSRADRRDSPRPVAEVTVGPDGKERQRRRYPSTAIVEVTGPNGEALSLETSTPEEAGPLTLWHLAAAIPAACRATIAMVRHDVEALGGSVAAIATDSIAVPAALVARLEPCPGGPHRLPDGTEAVRLLSFTELRGVLRRFDPLLHPNGGAAFKEEVGSLTAETFGLVCGVNKTLLGRDDGDGFRLLRSSDTGLGDHYLDPTGTGARLADGRTAWTATLQERLLADAVARGPGAAPRVPSYLPSWAEQPALCRYTASSATDIRWLRDQLGDPTIPAGSRYIEAPNGPVCTDEDRDPASWQARPWREDGKPARVAVLDRESRDGELVQSAGRGPVTVVPTVREVFASWLRERDITVEGPARGLRHVAPVVSSPALVQLVGKSGEYSGLDPDDDPLIFETPAAVSDLVAAATVLGVTEVTRRTGLPRQTAQDALSGLAKPSAQTVAKLAAATVEAPTERLCAGCGGALPPSSRAGRRWCSDACRKAAKRELGISVAPRVMGRPPAPSVADAVSGSAPDAEPNPRTVAATIKRLASLPGLPPAPLGLAMLEQSPALPDAVGACLAAGLTPVEVVARLTADGPLRGRSSVGILVARLQRLAPAVVEERSLVEAQDAARKEAARVWARRRGAQLALLVHAGELPADAAIWLIGKEIPDSDGAADAVRYVEAIAKEMAG